MALVLFQQKNPAAVKLLNQPSISITPLPRQTTNSQPSTSSGVTVQRQAGAAGGSNTTFVICEICDGYVKVFIYSSLFFIHTFCLRLSLNFGFIIFLTHVAFGTITESHAVDSQSKNPSENDLQQTSFKLSEVSIQVFHRSRFGASFAGISRLGHIEYARIC